MYISLLMFTEIHSFEYTKFMTSYPIISLKIFVMTLYPIISLKIFRHDQYLAESFASQILIIRPLRTKGMKHRKSSNLLLVLEAEVKLSNIVDQHDI